MGMMMTTIKKFLWGGNDISQTVGEQRIDPAVTAHEDVPIIGIDRAMQISSVWACVMMLAENIASLPINVYEPASRKGGSRVLPETNRLQTLIHRRPNRRQTSQEWWEQMLLMFFMRGNAYAYKRRDNKGELLELWPLSVDQTTAHVLETGDLVYQYSYNNETLIYLEEDILHLRGPGNGVVGMSPLDHMRSSLGLAIKTQDHMTKTFNKNARRPGVLMSDAVLKDDQRQALKNSFGDIVSGKDNELYILEAQFKFEPLGMTPGDLQLLESRKFSVQDLARWFGVPSVLINDTGESTALGSSTAQIIEAFFKLKLRPQLTRFEGQIEHQLMSSAQRAKRYTIKFTFDAILRATLKDRMEVYSKAGQNGIMTRNEIRAKEDMAPVSGGDDLTVQSNLVPLDKLGEVTPSPAANPVPEEPIQQ